MNGAFNPVGFPLFCLSLAEREQLPLVGKVGTCCILGKRLVVLCKGREPELPEIILKEGLVLHLLSPLPVIFQQSFIA